MFFKNSGQKHDKEKDPQRFQTMLLSVIFAIAIWLIVVYLNDPSIKITLSNVDVRFSGEAELRERGFVITDRSEIPSLSVSVSGKRSDLMDYMNNIYVSVNVDEINAPGEYELKTSVEIPTSKITLKKCATSKIKLDAEPLVTKKIQITAKQTGANKNFLIQSEVEESEIEISGAQNEIEKISYGAATVDVSTIHTVSEGVYPYVFYDYNNSQIGTKTSVESQTAVVHITNTPYVRKTLAVVPVLSDELAANYMIDRSRTVMSPTSIDVGVNSEFTENRVYAEIDKLATAEGTYYIKSEPGLYIPPSKNSVEITPAILHKQAKTLRVPITAVNMPEGATADFVQEIDVNIVCADSTEAADVCAEIDLTGLTPGTYKLPVKVSGSHVESASEPEIDVTVK